MNLRREVFIFMVQICSLFVYGTVSIDYSGSQIIGDQLVLKCTITGFIGTASWAKDGSVLSTCTTSFCSPEKHENVTTFSYGIDYIEVTFATVDSSIFGEWTCTHLTWSESFNLTGSSGGTSTSTKEYGKALAILSVCLLVAYFIVVAVRFCAGSTGNKSGNCFLRLCQFIEDKFFDCCGCKSSQKSEDDPVFFKDKVCTLISLLGFTYLVLYGLIVGVIVLLAVYYGSDKYQEVLVIVVGFVIVLVLSFLCLLVVVWMLKKFVNNETSKCEDKPENSRLR